MNEKLQTLEIKVASCPECKKETTFLYVRKNINGERIYRCLNCKYETKNDS